MKRPFKGYTRTIFDEPRHPLYYRWNQIKQNTTNPKTRDYPIYGGKGIGMYKPWNDNFNVFLLWCVKNGYRKELHLTRIDKAKHFDPSNCWFKPPNYGR